MDKKEEIAIPYHKLKKLKTYPFTFTIYTDIDNLTNKQAVKTALELAETAKKHEIHLLEAHLTLLLAGYKYLAYIFQDPQDPPWDKTSQAIKESRTTIYNSYAYPAPLLTNHREISREIQSLNTWIQSIDWRNQQLRKLAENVAKLSAKHDALKYGTEPQELLPKNEEQWIEYIESTYNTLKYIAETLHKLTNLLETSPNPNLILVLWWV